MQARSKSRILPAPREKATTIAMNPSCRELTSTVLAVMLVVGIPRFAAAGSWKDELKPQARAHFDLGVRYYSTQQYSQAIDELRAAYVEDPNPKILYTLGQAYRVSGDCVHAVEAYNAFLRSGPLEDAAKRARENIELCKKEDPLPVPPPLPDASVLPAPPSVMMTPPALAPWYTDVLGDSLLAGAVLAAGTAGVAAWIEQEHRLGLNTASSYHDYRMRLETADAAHHVEIGAIAVGIALIAGAAVRLYVRSRPPEDVSVLSTNSPVAQRWPLLEF